MGLFVLRGTGWTKLPSLEMLKVGKHYKGNNDGFKAERTNIRVIAKGRFESISSIDGIHDRLFPLTT